MEAAYHESKNHNKSIEHELAQKKSDLTDSTKRNNDLQSQVNQKESDLSRALTDLNILNSKLQDSKQTLEKTTSVLKQTQEYSENINNKLNH